MRVARLHRVLMQPFLKCRTEGFVLGVGTGLGLFNEVCVRT